MGQGGIWYDFSAGIGGGPIELIQKLKDSNCYEAAHFILEQGWASNVAAIHQTETEVRTKVEAVSELPKNEPIRQDLLPMCTYHEYLEKRGISEVICQSLGVGYLPQGRSPLRGRVVYQIRDARVNEENGERETVLLSHMGRAVDSETRPKYLFYEGFHKSVELLGQDRILLDKATAEQISQTRFILLMEGPFDWAKCIEAGLLNVVATMGAQISSLQCVKIKSLCEQYGIDRVVIAFDRDHAGHNGASKATYGLQSLGLEVDIFNWETQLGHRHGKPLQIPSNIRDLADFNVNQLCWLRKNKLL